MKFVMIALSLPCLPCLVMAQVAARPAWIDILPSRPGRVYAVGVAPLTSNQAQSLQQASQYARVELVFQLHASVKGTTLSQSSMTVQRQLGGPTTARSQQHVAEDSRISTQASDLPGLTVAETWVDTSGHTVYALAYMDVAKALLELQVRLDDVRKDSDAGAGAADESVARTIQRLKKDRAELARLDLLVDPLIAGGGSPLVRSDIRDTRQAIEQRLTLLRRSMTLCLRDDGSAMPGNLATVVRNAALDQGLGWVEGKGAYTVTVHLLDLPGAGKATMGPEWWAVLPSPDFTEARATLEITIVDRYGHAYQPIPVEAKGLGTSETAAGQGLLQDCRKKLDKVFDQWLDDLAL